MSEQPVRYFTTKFANGTGFCFDEFSLASGKDKMISSELLQPGASHLGGIKCVSL
jgi:hypothetical protein